MNKLNKYTDAINNVVSKSWVKIGAIFILGMVIGSLLSSGEDQAPIVALDHADHQDGTTWTCSMHPQIKLVESGQCPICFMDLIPLAGNETSPNSHEGHSEQAGKTTWTCSMDPQVKLDEPGQCPICFMDLIPLENEGVSQEVSEITLSPDAIKLAKIMTSPARMGLAKSDIQLSGKIDYDETRIKNISAWFPGRLEHLYVDYTGIRVNRGDHLLEIYSPELYSTQSELLLAHSRMTRPGQSASVLEASTVTYENVLEKTKLLGLSSSQINSIIATGKAQSVLQINSPITGIVIHKNAIEGKYVKTGEQIYAIADLSQVWVNLDVYEKDLPWLTYGQKISLSVAGLPGKIFFATISYIDPLVNATKQSVTVRAVLDNQKGLLKPGMLAEATIEATLNSEGLVVSPDLSGTWACPMHPEVIDVHPGNCSICGMDLVPLVEISGAQAASSQALLIPASAVLKTGHRVLVYIQNPNIEAGIFSMKEIVIGPRVGKEYIVLEGLAPGELVVSNGNFKIDSAMQIAGKPSMMSRDDEGVKPIPAGHHHG